jgi:hypothetical protein
MVYYSTTAYTPLRGHEGKEQEREGAMVLLWWEMIPV